MSDLTDGELFLSGDVAARRLIPCRQDAALFLWFRSPSGIAIGCRASSDNAGGAMALVWAVPNLTWAKRLRPNPWDAIALPIVLGLVALLAYGSQQAAAPFQLGDQIQISLD